MGGRISSSVTLRQVFNKVDRGGEPDWLRLPESSSPDIWDDYNAGFAGLECMLFACEDPRLFSSAVLFSYLLDPGKAPDSVRPWLLERNVCAELGCLLPLNILEAARWRKVAVPVAVRGVGRLVWVLTGAGTDLALFPVGSEVFDAVAKDAAACAEKLVAGKWGRTMAVWPMSPGGGASTVAGPSLGLPLFLGAAAACLDLPTEKVVATGALTETGEVLRVGGGREKANCLPVGTAVFLHPQDLGDGVSLVSGIAPKCVSVDTVDQAVSVLFCQGPDLAPRVVASQNSLSSGTDVARSLCSLCTGMEGWVRHNRKEIDNALYGDEELGELVRQVAHWCLTTTGKDGNLGRALLDCIGLDTGRALAGSQARRAWDLALLQMDKANHRGDIESFSAWQELARELRSEIHRLDGGDRENLLYYVRTTISDCHNRYDFDPDLPARMLDSMGLVEDLAAMEENFERRRRRCGPCEESVLGRYYGTMGQHFLFCGGEFYSRGMEFLDKAMRAFGEGKVEGDCLKDWKRDMFYHAFALLEDGQTGEAQEALARICRPEKNAWCPACMTPFELHCLLRIHVDEGKEVDFPIWNGAADLVRDMEADRHPGQLLAYNLGRLAPDFRSRREWYECSLQRCRNKRVGPTIRAMALLPMSRMHAEGMDLPDMAQKCEEVRNVLKCYGLHSEHFRCVLDAGSWQEMLETVVNRERELFPYMYR